MLLKKLPAKILANFRNLNFSGFCINDAGSILYSDFSSGTAKKLRQFADMMDELRMRSASMPPDELYDELATVFEERLSDFYEIQSED